MCRLRTLDPRTLMLTGVADAVEQRAVQLAVVCGLRDDSWRQLLRVAGQHHALCAPHLHMVWDKNMG